MRVSCMRAAGVLSLALLSACSTLPVHQALPTAAREQIASTDIVAPVPQSEVYVFVAPATGGAGFGLVGALIDVSIDSARTSKAESSVTTLRNAMVDYSFDNSLQRKLTSTLAQVSWLHSGNAGVIRDVTAEGLDKSVAASNAAAVLFVAADYHLNNDADVMQVTLGAWLVPKSDALMAMRAGKVDAKHISSRGNALYRNSLVFEARITGSGTRDGNIAKWSADNGRLARKVLDTALDKLTSILVADIQRSEADKAPSSSAMQTTVPPPTEASACTIVQIAAQCESKAAVDGTDADGQVLRFEDGSIRYESHAVFE